MSAPRRNIVWIASYPKSGNTWMRFLLCNLLYGQVDSADELARLTPDLHEVGQDLDVSLPGILVKTHFLYSTALPFAERTSAAIYVVRDPVDVFASNFHYYRRRSGGDGLAAALDQYFQAFMENRGDPRWRQLGMGGWDENVHSWLDPARPFPVICVRYEDLSRDPHTICARLAATIRPGTSPKEVERAVENSSFKRMCEIEAADIEAQRVGIFYKSYLQPAIDAGVRFMRKGIAGDGVTCLEPARRARLRSLFEPTLRWLGYAPH